jgi:hypothetical protein
MACRWRSVRTTVRRLPRLVPAGCRSGRCGGSSWASGPSGSWPAGRSRTGATSGYRTLNQETATPPAASLPAQQQRFDGFRAVYNNARPHEALGQQTPASRYQPSPRRCPERVDDPHYGQDVAVRRVPSNGQIKWAGELIFVGEALIGEPVGILETEGGDWLVRYADVELGYIHPQRRRLSPRPLHGGAFRPMDLMEITDVITTTQPAQ